MAFKNQNMMAFYSNMAIGVGNLNKSITQTWQKANKQQILISDLCSRNCNRFLFFSIFKKYLLTHHSNPPENYATTKKTNQETDHTDAAPEFISVSEPFGFRTICVLQLYQ